MAQHSLEKFIDVVSGAWGPLTSELVAKTQASMAQLLRAPVEEDWLAALQTDGPESRQLHRDVAREFLLLGHTENEGLYRPPHDHGRGWVVYGVQRGEMEMATYRRVHDLQGSSYLVKRESFVLRAGDTAVFLPGDIHDTRCTAGPLSLLRFTSRDLKKEEVTRYPLQSPTPWTAAVRNAS